jgi:hypothetical protein
MYAATQRHHAPPRLSVVGIGARLVMEVSSPPLHLREVFKELGVTSTSSVVDILFVVTFARMGVGTYLT